MRWAAGDRRRDPLSSNYPPLSPTLNPQPHDATTPPPRPALPPAPSTSPRARSCWPGTPWRSSPTCGGARGGCTCTGPAWGGWWRRCAGLVGWWWVHGERAWPLLLFAVHAPPPRLAPSPSPHPTTHFHPPTPSHSFQPTHPPTKPTGACGAAGAPAPPLQPHHLSQHPRVDQPAAPAAADQRSAAQQAGGMAAEALLWGTQGGGCAGEAADARGERLACFGGCVWRLCLGAVCWVCICVRVWGGGERWIAAVFGLEAANTNCISARRIQRAPHARTPTPTHPAGVCGGLFGCPPPLWCVNAPALRQVVGGAVQRGDGHRLGRACGGMGDDQGCWIDDEGWIDEGVVCVRPSFPHLASSFKKGPL